MRVAKSSTARLVASVVALALGVGAAACGKYGRPVRAQTQNGDAAAEGEERRATDPDPQDAFEPIFDGLPVDETSDGGNR